jgi:HEAT repeat protein
MIDHSAIFAQHFSRLVWLASKEATQPGDIDFAARAAEAMLRAGGATLTVRDWHLAVNDKVLPQALSGVPDLMLAARLVGHSVQEIVFEAFSPSGELAAAARILAAEPELADRGKAVAAQFQMHTFGKVHLSVTGSMSPDTSSAAIAELDAARRRFSSGAPEAAAAGRAATEAPWRVARPPEAASAQPRPLAAAQGNVADTIAAGIKAGKVARVLEDLARDAENAALTDDTGKVFEVVYGIVSYEAASRAPELRAAYVVALKRLVRPAIVRALARYFGAHRDQEGEVLAIFTRMGDEGAELLVEALADSQIRFERRALFDIIGRMKTGEQSLRHLLNDPRWYVVRNAAELLGQIQAEGAAPDLIPLATHADDRVRRAAVAALAQLSVHHGTTDALIKALGDPSGIVRAVAVAGLGTRKGGKSLEALVDRLDQEDDDAVLEVIMEALGRNGSPTAVQKLVEASEPSGLLFKRKSVAYRTAAALALRNLDSPVARAALEKLREDKEPSVRSAAGG